MGRYILQGVLSMDSYIIKLVLISSLLIIGCDEKKTADGDVIVCTASIEPAIRINVFDKETGFQNACGVTVKLQDGDFIEELSNPASDSCKDDLTFSLADEREGKYDITIIKEGYVDWYQYDISVSSNLCHVNTISIQAYLEK